MNLKTMTKLELETLWNYRTGLFTKVESQKILRALKQKEAKNQVNHLRQKAS